jgi:hypothetical protein
VAITSEIVALLQRMLEGKDGGNVTNQVEAVLALSLSDANTASMVDSGVLDAIALALLQVSPSPPPPPPPPPPLHPYRKLISPRWSTHASACGRAEFDLPVPNISNHVNG